MRPARRLALSRERVTELAPADLGRVAGGAPPTLPLNDCLDVPNTRYGQGACAHTAFDCITRHNCG